MVRDRPTPTRAPVAGPSVAEAARPRAGRLIAIIALVVIAMRVDIPGNMTAGAVLSIVMIPLWWSTLKRYRGARSLLVFGGVALLSGAWLTELSRSTNPVSVSLMISISVLVGGALCSVGVVLWSRQFLTDAQVALAYGAGLLLGVSPNSALFAENPWKFGFAVPVTVIMLALAQMIGGRIVEGVVVLGLTVASAFSDARSSFAILMFTALLVFWQMRPRRASRRASALRVVAGLCALGAIVYTFGQSLILDGVLGEQTRQRSLEQIDTSGSLLLGGRPELAATLALLQRHPWGYGSGTIPNLGDVTTAKTGMAAIAYEPDNGYVENYMFGGRFELHSLFGDFWAFFGIPGIVLVVVLAVVLVRGLSERVAHNTAGAVLIYVAIRTLWNVPFGPVYSSVPLLILAVGLALLPADDRRRLPGMGRTPAIGVRPPPSGEHPPNVRKN
ncbi:O-antigen ligase family protein [Agromyces sp. NPDC058484]|uniref:O-antigen ligase family protein n=1 Tax=Agromyces sp. NPDC058484 TaxID=3346524 RepID=UPI0036654BD4